VSGEFWGAYFLRYIIVVIELVVWITIVLASIMLAGLSHSTYTVSAVASLAILLVVTRVSIAFKLLPGSVKSEKTILIGVLVLAVSFIVSEAMFSPRIVALHRMRNLPSAHRNEY